MIGKDKALEVMNYLILHGKEEACKAFSLTEETLNRYKREAKKHFGDSLDLVVGLSEKFTTEELKQLANGSLISPNDTKHMKHDFNGEEITFGIMSDTHIGSIYTNPMYIAQAFEEMEKNNCAFIAHAGDLVEGFMGRPGDVYELSHIGYKAQRDEAVRLFKDWTKPLYIVAGNHSMSFNTKIGAGMDITEDFCSRIPNGHYLGVNDGVITLNGAKIMLWHGGDGSAVSLGYRDQKLADSFSGGEKPHALITGHLHKAHYFFYRNIHIIGGVSLQRQSGWMRAKKLQAHVGFWIIKTAIAKGEIKWMQTRWYPFYE